MIHVAGTGTEACSTAARESVVFVFLSTIEHHGVAMGMQTRHGNQPGADRYAERTFIFHL
jgi:hypothetical protein